MRRAIRAAEVALGAIALLALAPWLGGGTAAAQQEVFRGTIARSGGIGPSGLSQFTIRVESYTTDEEVLSLAKMLQEEGQRKLEDTVLDLDRARFQLPGQLSHNIGIVRSLPAANGGRIVRFVSARPLFLFEAVNNPRSRDHPFGIIELHLDADGKGNGGVFAAAKLSFNREGRLEVESYGIPPYQILTVEVED